jgi:methyltransferase (TIGR00027 family)
MTIQADTAISEFNAFRLEAQPLLESVLAREANLPARAQHSMPRQFPAHSTQRPRYLPSRAVESRCVCDGAVGRDFSFGDFRHRFVNRSKHHLLLIIVTIQAMTRSFVSSVVLGCAALGCVLLRPLGALDPDEPSRVAIEAAAARAVGSHDPDPFTRNPDWLAGPLLSPNELALISSHPVNRAVDQDPRISVQDPDVLPLIKLNAVRTRFIDDLLQRATRSGTTQVVILGAGLDSRAYRFRALLQAVKVFELDNGPTQEMKKRRIQDVFGAPPPNVKYVPIDSERDSLATVLRKAGFRLTDKAFFIWEGGCMYYREPTVRSILRDISKSAPGSSLVMDFAFADGVARARHDPTSSQQRFHATWGEPWLFGVPDNPGVEAFFRQLGFEPAEMLPVDSPTAVRRYLTHRDQTVVGMGLAVQDLAPITLVALKVGG